MNKILLVLLFIIVISSIFITSLRDIPENYLAFYNGNIITIDANQADYSAILLKEVGY